MPLLALWVVTAPFAAGALIGSSPAARRAVARHFVLALALGWTALVFLVASVVVLHIPPGVPAIVAAPLIGLAFWRYRDGPDDPPRGDEEPEPPGGDVDWDEFMRQLERWSQRREPRPGRPVARV